MPHDDKDKVIMAAILNSAQKAWETRRRNGTATAAPATNAERAAGHELIMTIGLSEANGLSAISASFHFEQAGKAVLEATLIPEDSALCHVRLVSSIQMVESVPTLAGHDHVQAHIDGCGSDVVASILPLMLRLDSLLSKRREDSEDSSFPMAVQCLSWDQRVAWVVCDGKRTKRGAVYSTMETVADSVIALHAPKKA
jgi:hypothetical protein